MSTRFRSLFSALTAAVAVLLPCPVLAQGKATKFVTQTGTRIIVRPDTNSDVVAICVFVKAGAADEGNTPGIGNVVARAIFGANVNQSAEEVNHCIYDVGGSLSVAGNPDYSLITCVTTTAQFHDAFYLICNALKSPQFGKETVEKAKADAAADFARETTDTFRIAYEALRGRMYRYSPYRLPFGGGSDTLKRITPDTAARFHARYYTPESTVISIVGKIRVKDVEEDAENYFVDYKRPAPRQAAVAAERPREEGRVERKTTTSTSFILAGFPGPGINDPDYPALVVLTALAGGGKSSRLWQVMRETAGVGYVVGANLPPLALESHLLAFTEFDPSRKSAEGKEMNPAEIEQLLVKTVRSFIETPPTIKELERAKTYAIGTNALAHQRTRDRAFYLGWYEVAGPGYSFDQDLARRIAAVTMDDIAAAAKKYLATAVIAVIKPENTPRVISSP